MSEKKTKENFFFVFISFDGWIMLKVIIICNLFCSFLIFLYLRSHKVREE